MQIFFFWIVLSVLVYMYAGKKGRDQVKALLASLILSPIIGFLIVAILEDKSDENKLDSGELKKCHACAELIKKDAVKCKHCGELIVNSSSKNDIELNKLIASLKKDE